MPNWELLRKANRLSPRCGFLQLALSYFSGATMKMSKRKIFFLKKSSF